MNCFRTCDLRIRTLTLVLMWLAIGPAHDATAQSTERTEQRLSQFRQRRREALLNLQHELSQVSRMCVESGMPEMATDITALSLDLTSPGKSERLPQMAQLPLNPKGSTEQRTIMNRIALLRTDKAKALYTLARSALREARLPSFAYELIHDVLRLDPDHKLARAVLGQQLFHEASRKDDPTYAGEWVSPFEAAKRTGSNPEVDHPNYGWIPAANISRYEEGLRPWRGQWISSQKEAELRRNFSNAWEVRTEHFLIRTNTSLEEGVELSRKLEVYYDWLHSSFAAFFDTPAELQARFAQAQPGRRRVTNPQPMEVHYFATREEYNQSTRGKVPPTIVTNGLYWEPDRTCYLFRNPEDEELSTAFHEATHQILDWATREHRLIAARKYQRVARQQRVQPWVLCRNSNFWVLEGVACYMESFRITDDGVAVGGPNNIRFVGATHRLLVDDFYIDLRSFSSLGEDGFRRHPNHTQLYTQGSGVAHFLLHYDDGVYRDALVQLLSDVYRPDLTRITEEPSLAEITGVSFDELDLQYRDHMLALSNQQQ